MAWLGKCGLSAGPLTYSQMIDEISASLGKSIVKVCPPVRVARSIAWAMEKLSTKPQLTIDQINRMAEDRAFGIEEDDTSLGFDPRPFSKGLHQAVRS